MKYAQGFFPTPKMALVTTTKKFIQCQKELGVDEPREPVPGAAGSTVTFDTDDGWLAAIVHIKPDLDRADAIGLLVHEAVHVKQAWCLHMHEGNPGDEFEAYAVQSIFLELLRMFDNGARDAGKIPARRRLSNERQGNP